MSYKYLLNFIYLVKNILILLTEFLEIISSQINQSMKSNLRMRNINSTMIIISFG